MLMDMPHATWVVAMLWAIVVGSSLYSAELNSRLGLLLEISSHLAREVVLV